MLATLLLTHTHTNAGCSKLVGAGTFDNGHYNDDDHQMNVVDRFVAGTVPERLWAEPYNTSYPDGTRPRRRRGAGGGGEGRQGEGEGPVRLRGF